MDEKKAIEAEAKDPILEQAETILSQRRTRALVIDPDVLGEPGWDILLSAFIAHRKGSVCSVEEVAAELTLTRATAERWVQLLTLKGLVVRKDGFFSVSDDASAKLGAMFKKQIDDTFRAFKLYSAGRGGGFASFASKMEQRHFALSEAPHKIACSAKANSTR